MSIDIAGGFGESCKEACYFEAVYRVIADALYRDGVPFVPAMFGK